MRIAFDRFVALTAALAGAGGTLSACGSDTADTDFSTGGVSAGSSGKGGSAGGGRATGGSAGKGNAGSGGSANSGGSAGNRGGSAGAGPQAGDGGAPPATGGTSGSGGAAAGMSGEAGEGGAAGRADAGAGDGGEPAAAGTANVGGTAGVPGGAGEGGAAVSGAAGHGRDNGEGGAPAEACLDDTGIADCSELGLPTDECMYTPNPLLLSCYASTGGLRPGALEGLGHCLLAITDDVCSSEAAADTYACEAEVARRACPAPEALDACANGLVLEGGSSVDSPLVACDDGTLTQDGCTELLNAVKPSALWEVVKCADPAGEYGGVFSGTCAERLHHCVFPHSWFYPW